MKYAESIKYGGEWVSALKCNHTSAQNLGLICPECKEAIFWVEGHKRSFRDGKRVEIDSRFNHFKKAKADCELRVNSVSKEQLEQRNSIARGQRLEKIKRWFWTIFSNYFTTDIESKWTISQFIYAIKKATGAKAITHDNYGDNFLRVGLEFWEMQLGDFRDYIIDGASAGDTGFKTAVMLYENAINTNPRTIVQSPYELSEAQLDLHLDIVKEVVEFMLTSQQTDLRNKTCTAIAWTSMQLFKKSKYKDLMDDAINEVRLAGLTAHYAKMPDFLKAAQQTLAQAQFAALALIPWGEEFERLELGSCLNRELTEFSFPKPTIPSNIF